MQQKVIVRTKTGLSLAYYLQEGDTESKAAKWWLTALDDRSDTAVIFGRYVIPASNIDFVEFK